MAPRGQPSSVVLLVAIAMAVVAIVVASGLCPARCRCDDEFLRASCVAASLDVVPIQLNPDIRHLDLSGNRVASLHLTFGFYGNLETLNLGSNLIHTLGSDNFLLQQRLTALNVSSNAIRNISKNALRGLQALRELDLSENNVVDMDDQAFRYTSELEQLNLAGNSLTRLPDGLLRNLHKIHTLILGKNSLLEVPSRNLALAPSLEHLDFSDNLIEELDRDSLPSLPSLVTLNLADNVVRSITDDAFERLPSLQHLDLSGNNLTSVPTMALSKLSVLTALSLSNNPLGALRIVAFRNLFELRSLELNKCSITAIHARAFADNVNLERISMDDNRDLLELPARILYGARYLRRVSLRYCSLATLQPTYFPVDSLFSLKVGGNPLVCNCSVLWLWNVIRSEERGNTSRDSSLRVDSREIICADEEFAGKTLISLNESSLRCHLSTLYLALFVAGCLTTTAMILALIVYVTRAKRRKQPAYSAPRPELLVYVGQGAPELDGKSTTESYSRRLIGRLEDVGYDVPAVAASAPDSKTLVPCDDDLYDKPCNINARQHPLEEGIYAVADVTNLRDHDVASEVLSLGRLHSAKSRSNNLPPVYVDYDYEAPFQYQKQQKPYIVFV